MAQETESKQQQTEIPVLTQETGLNRTDDYASTDELHEQLLGRIRKYHPSTDVSVIEKAYEVARDSHKGQFRKSGEPYIIHPLCVAMILAELEMDKETIAAGLLHDVVEDTSMTKEELSREFGSEVAFLVDGVTKLSLLSGSLDKIEVQAENLRKMFLAMAKDIRVIMIKLADRLHNMRTLKYHSEQKQKEIARETMDIYAPIAGRLGISKVKIELEDLSLKYSNSEVYYDLVEKIAQTKATRDSFVSDIVSEVHNQMEKAEIKAKVYGRAKHFFSIYRKMVNGHKTLDQIYDLFAVRIIVDDIKACYAALGVIHEFYKPIPGRFKDYIAVPKPNMYQSLHTTLIAPNGQPFEIQIRTEEMHRTAEYGIAAHWKYKEGVTASSDMAKSAEEKLSWLRQILEWQQDMSDNKEFMNLLKNDLDLFSESIYCFTPTGDVKDLPSGSTPVDFAYSIHSGVGNKMVGARVNGKMVPIDYVIQNGDRVEIITSPNCKGPSRDWLKIVKSTQAKNKINQFFKQELKEDNIKKGREMFDRYCRMKGIAVADITKPELKEVILKKYSFKDWDSIMAAIGHGGMKEGQIVNRLVEEAEKKHRQEITDEEIAAEINKTSKTKVSKAKGGIMVKGIDDVAVRFSKCCNPVPGDPIVGFVTRGRGVSVHRADCINVINLPQTDRVRIIDADWQEGTDDSEMKRYSTRINIYANNRTGILADISRIMEEKKIDLTAINSKTSKQGLATISISFDIRGKEELNNVIDRMRNINSVIGIERVSG